MIYGILLIYYDNCERLALEKFFDIVGRLGKEYEVVAINNANPGVWVTEHKKYAEIGGDNRVREFSGWDRGIQYIKSRTSIREEDFFVFGNDTFCSHRDWHAVIKRRFIKSVKKLRAQEGAGICGEVNSFGESFELIGLRADNWVSTYLFGATGSYLMNSDYRLSLTERELSLMVQDIKKGQVIWKDVVDPNLQAHIQQWLFPTEGAEGWYGAEAESDEIKLQKLRAILNEKYISAKCYNLKGSVVDVGYPVWFKLINKLRLLLGKEDSVF